MAEYLQRGEALDYTNATDNLIPNDTVVALKDRIGVTGCPIPPGKTGSLHMTGVFEIKKTGTAAIEMGQTVYFDGTGITDAADNGKTGDERAEHEKDGYDDAPAEDSRTSVLVSING